MIPYKIGVLHKKNKKFDLKMQKIQSFFKKNQISRKFLDFLRKKMLYCYCAGLNPPLVVDVGPAFFMLFVQGFGRIIPSDIGSNKLNASSRPYFVLDSIGCS